MQAADELVDAFHWLLQGSSQLVEKAFRFDQLGPVLDVLLFKLIQP